MGTRTLRRSRSDRRIAGVCGGLARYFGIDSTIIRIIFVLLALPGGVPGTLLYLILWVVLPEE
jgi:phage shock protein C